MLEVVVTMGEVVPDQNIVFQIQFFVNANGSSGSNFNIAVLSRNLKKNWPYEIL